MIEFLVSVVRALRLFIASVGVISLVEPLDSWVHILAVFNALLDIINVEISYQIFLAESVTFYQELADSTLFWIDVAWRDGALLAFVLFGPSILSFLISAPQAMIAVRRRREVKDRLVELSDAAGLDEDGRSLRLAYEERYGSMTRGDMEAFLQSRVRDLGYRSLDEVRERLGGIRDELNAIKSSDDILRQNFIGFSLSGYLLAIGLMMTMFSANYIMYNQYSGPSVFWAYVYAAPIASYFFYQMAFKKQIERGFPLTFCRWSVAVLGANLLLWLVVADSWVGWGLAVTAAFLVVFSFARIRLF